MRDTCTFCRWSSGEGVNIWQNELFISRFDSFPVSPGHALIIPRRHVVDIAHLSQEEWLGLSVAIQAVISIIESKDLKSIYEKMLENPVDENSVWFCKQAIAHPRINTKPDAYNHGVNDGRAAGRTVDHLHWHVIPRYLGDMDDPRGGVRYVRPDMGNYKIGRE